MKRCTNDFNHKRGESLLFHDPITFSLVDMICIDPYSRNILWLYVGVSNRTGHSVLRQYLDTCITLEYAQDYSVRLS